MPFELDIRLEFDSGLVLETHEIKRLIPNNFGVVAIVESWISREKKDNGSAPFFPGGKSVFLPVAAFQVIFEQAMSVAKTAIESDQSLLNQIKKPLTISEIRELYNGDQSKKGPDDESN